MSDETTESEILARLNENAFGFIKMLGGHASAFSKREQSCTLSFDISRDFCHSMDVVQGGFVTAMLDAAMSHSMFGLDDGIVNVTSLEIKTMFLEPTRAGLVHAQGKVVRAGYKIAFLEGELRNEAGEITATATTVGKLIRKA